MTGPARPTLYKPEHAGRARELCARGATNPDLAGRFGVAETGGNSCRNFAREPVRSVCCLTQGTHSSAVHT